MRTTRLLTLALTAITLGLCFLAVSHTSYVVSGFSRTAPSRTALQTSTIPIDDNDIAGVVSDARGPAAGVWVVAETTDLPTKFARIVVTDDRGRYLIPDLPKAGYSVWVRGYGLVDSPKTQARPGTHLNLTSVPATSPQAAAQYFPSGYWFSLMRVPEKKEFPGTGPQGNGISPDVKSQADWLRMLKSGTCWACHALGTKATRELPAALGHFDSSAVAWQRRLQSGQAGRDMTNALTRFGPTRALAMFADWTDRIAAGETPPAPPRPQGIERNVVITEWDWADPKVYLHDEVSIGTASRGWRSPADISRASTAASARGRSTGLPRPVSSARKGGHSTPSRCRR